MKNNINSQLGFRGAPTASGKFANADGATVYKTLKQTQTYYAVPVIVRDRGIAGPKLSGTTLFGSPTPEKISVVNSDGTDASSYYFLVTELDGKKVYVNMLNLQQVGSLGNQYIVKEPTYPYLPEMWINKTYRATDLPYGYAFAGTPVSIKTVRVGYLTKPENYIKVNAENQYVPVDNAVTEDRWEVLDKVVGDMSAPPTTTQNVNPKLKGLVDAGEVTLGGEKPVQEEIKANTDDRNMLLKLYQNPDGSFRWLPITGTLGGIIVAGIFIRGLLK